VVFGLFRLLGFRLCPSLVADIRGTRFWRVDPKADYGELNVLARQRIHLDRIVPHWDDVLRFVGSLKFGRLSAMNIMRTLQARNVQAVWRWELRGGPHRRNHTHTELHRRRDAAASTLQQLNLTEGRHSLAPNVFHGKRGELCQRYREGQEDQLSALGLVVNMIVLWNTIYMNAVLDQLRAESYDVRPEDEARLSPLAMSTPICLGRYSFVVPDAVARGELRPLRTQTNPEQSNRQAYP
jgi:TnpA family transposase